MLRIEPIPVLADNYVWLLSAAGRAVVVDPGEAAPVLAVLAARQLRLEAVLLTHHHHDHVGGLGGLLAATPEVQVFASRQDAIAGVTHPVGDGDRFSLLGEGFEVLATPGHTLGAVCYLLPESDAVFTGDTLFLAGCGRLFEGTPEMMVASLAKLRRLAPATRVYCGHEYTEKNLTFVARELAEEAVNQRLERVRRERAAGRPTVPATLEEELRTNPFLRTDEPAMIERLGATTALAAWTELRRRRNQY